MRNALTFCEGQQMRKAEEAALAIEAIESDKARNRKKDKARISDNPPQLTQPVDDINDWEEIPQDETDIHKRLKTEHQIKEFILKDHIPPGYQLGISAINNDSFFDAVARNLNHLTDTKEYSVESLRKLCAELVHSERPAWLKDDAFHKYGGAAHYLPRIEFSVSEMNTRNRTRTLIGEAIKGGELEARLLCIKLGIRVHWIDVKESGEVIEKITDESGTLTCRKRFSSDDYLTDPKMIHLVKKDDHIVPLFNLHETPSLNLNEQPAVTAVTSGRRLSVSEVNNTLPINSSSRRLSVQQSKAEAFNRLRELLKTEDDYLKKLKKFALTELPGIKPKKEKTWWQRWFAFDEEEEEVTNKIPGGWSRIRKIAIDNKLMSEADLHEIDIFVSKYEALAKAGHAFPYLLDPKQAGYSNLENEGYTDENFTQWVDVLYKSICTHDDEVDEIINGRKTGRKIRLANLRSYFEINIFPHMNALKEMYWSVSLQDKIARLKELLSKNQSKVSPYDRHFFELQTTAAYLEDVLIQPVQRIGRYPLLINDIVKATNETHAAYPKLVAIKNKIELMTQFANNKPKELSANEAVEISQYQPKREYSELGLSPAILQFMVQLNSLINCWYQNDLGKKIFDEQQNYLLEIIINPEETHAKREEARRKHYENRTLWEQISQENRKDLPYVEKLQQLLHKLIINPINPDFKEPVTSRIYQQIDSIFEQLDPNNSVFCRSLKQLVELESSIISDKVISAQEGIYNSESRSSSMSPRPVVQKVPSFYGQCIPSEIYKNNVIDVLSPQPKQTMDRASRFSHFTTPKKNLKELPPEKMTSINAVTEIQQKQAIHFLRISIIHQVKSFFYQFDQYVQNATIFKPASIAIQQTSYAIQQELNELAKLTPEKLAELCKKSKDDKEAIREVIIAHLRKHLAVAGVLKESYTKGAFGNTLKQVNDYLNNIVNTDARLNTLDEMFVANPLPKRIRSSAPEAFYDNRSPNEKLYALLANIQKITDYYCNTGLGIKLAERAKVPINTKFRHQKHINKLANFSEQMFLAIPNPELAQNAIDEILGYLKGVIESIPENDHSRSINELIHLHNAFAIPAKHIPEREYKERFKNHAQIHHYRIAKDDAEKYLIMHMIQTYAKEFLDYDVAIDNRWVIETATCKNNANKEILSMLNKFYNMPIRRNPDSFEYHGNTKIEYLEDNYLNHMPEGQRNISCLIQKCIKEINEKSLSQAAIFNQGKFGKALLNSDVAHIKLNADLRSSVNASLQSDRNSADANLSDADRAPLLPERASASQQRQDKSKQKKQPPNPLNSNKVTCPLLPAFSEANVSSLKKFKDTNPAIYSNKDALISLVAQLLALSHYYRNTSFGVQIGQTFNIASNNTQGQAEFAKEIADYALEIFLQDESDYDENDTEHLVKQRNKNSAERLKALHDRMAAIIHNIRGDGSSFSSLTHSPNSRFAKALDELLPKAKRKMSDINQTSKLLFTTDQNNNLFKDKPDYAKHFIHKLVVEQSCSEFIDLEKNLMGRLKKGAGDMQQQAAHNIHIALKNISHLPLASIESQVTKLGYGKNIRHVVMDNISKVIVRCGRISSCYSDGVFGEKLFNVVKFLDHNVNIKTKQDAFRKHLIPNLVRKFDNTAIVVNRSVAETRLALMANLLMLYDFYLDNELGRQVADKGAYDRGKGFTATYNSKSKGWQQQAEKIKEIALGLYFINAVSESDNKNQMKQALASINNIITSIRDSLGGSNSRFANELIRIVNNFGKEHNLNLPASANISGNCFSHIDQYVFRHDISSENSVNYIQQHIIFHTSKPLTDVINVFDRQRWTVASENLLINSAITNLNTFFMNDVEKRQEAIDKLSGELRSKARKFIKQPIQPIKPTKPTNEEDPNFDEHMEIYSKNIEAYNEKFKVYALEKAAYDDQIKKIDQSSKYQANICHVILNQIENIAPFSSIFSSISEAGKSCFKKACRACQEYLNNITKPFEFNQLGRNNSSQPHSRKTAVRFNT